MRSVLLLSFIASLIPFSFGQLGTTDVSEFEIISELIDMISSFSCPEILEDTTLFCCKSQVILDVFEKMYGFKTEGFCTVYNTTCVQRNCQPKDTLTCYPDTCPQLTEEEKKLENEILSGKYSEQELIDLVFYHIFKEPKVELEVNTGEFRKKSVDALLKHIKK